MDYDAEVLRAPAYTKGDILDDLLGLRKQFPVTVCTYSLMINLTLRVRKIVILLILLELKKQEKIHIKKLLF